MSTKKAATTGIKCRLRVLMAERDLTMTEVSEKTGVAMSTLGKLVNNTAKGVHYKTLASLHKEFGWTIGDIFINAK